MFNCFRYFDVSREEIELMTLKEYLIRMDAMRFRLVDDDLKLAKQSWFNQQVKAQKKKGKSTVSAYKDFKSFFDYEKQIKDLTGKGTKVDEKHKKLAQIAMEFNTKNK